MEAGRGWSGKRVYLKKLKEEQNEGLIQEICRKCLSRFKNQSSKNEAVSCLKSLSLQVTYEEVGVVALKCGLQGDPPLCPLFAGVNATMLYHHAPVLHEKDTRFPGKLPGCLAFNIQLEPDDVDVALLPSTLHSFLNHSRNLIGGTKNLQDIDVFSNILDAVIGLSADDLIDMGIDGNDVVSLRCEIGGDPMRCCLRIAGDAINGDRTIAGKDISDGLRHCRLVFRFSLIR